MKRTFPLFWRSWGGENPYLPDIRQPILVPPSLRSAVYCNGLRHGDGTDYEFLWNRMLETNVANEARTILEILGCTSDEQKTRELLSSVLLQDSQIKTQDLTAPLSSILSYSTHIDVILDNLNCTEWRTIYPSMETILTTIAGSLHDSAHIEKFESILNSNQCDADAVTGARNTLLRVKEKQQWAADHAAQVLDKIGNQAFISVPSLSFIALTLGALVLAN